MNTGYIRKDIIDEFKELFFQDYQISLTDEEAYEKCTLLFSAMDILTKDLTCQPFCRNNKNVE